MKKKVSVIMITYNHERFIKKAIDSVLMQKMNFSYELIIADDCSPDNTQDIIREYMKSNDNIVPILRKKNIGISLNVLDAIEHATGEYIAFLEGDDYWIGENKLQKQIDFLDNNREYVSISAESMVVNQYDEVTDEKAWRFTIDENEYKISNLEKLQLPGQMSTMVMKNYKGDIKEAVNKVKKCRFCPLDTVLPLLLLSKGKMYVMKEILSAYRHFVEENGTSWSSNNDLNRTNNFIFFFLIIKDVERCGRILGYSLNLLDEKVKYYNMAYDAIKKYHSEKAILMCLAMFVLEKHRIKLLRAARDRRRRL